VKYKVNDTWLYYEAAGERKYGKQETLLHHSDDLTGETTWAHTGFVIEKLFSEEEYISFKNKTIELLFSLWRAGGLIVPQNFSPEQYHTLIHDRDAHLCAVEQTKLIQAKDFPGGIARIEKRISEICNIPLKALNPFDAQSIFHFRVIRPASNDNNPLHRDVWLEDYSDCINLYIPVAGSNALSSLILIPGSHQWPESRVERTQGGSKISNVQFNVPAVTDIDGDYNVERPDPKENEVLVFSPYLIHGGAINLNTNITRVSIELRLWRRAD
jgi:hypothetical protein